jgi:hypothetical protein
MNPLYCLLTNLTEEGAKPLTVINLHSLVSEDCAAVNHIDVLNPNTIVVLIILLLLSQELVQS